MTGQYDHLHLTAWPFPSAPSREYCTFIADRARVKEDVASLLGALSRLDSSQIQLFWSWLGAGKTHTLYYLANQADELNKQSAGNRLYPLYSEFPKAPKGFLDVYRSFVVGLDPEQLKDAYEEVLTSAEPGSVQRDLALASPDLPAALQVMLTGEVHDSIVAHRWLRADLLPVGDFRRLGISQKITSSEDASRILGGIVRLLRAAAISEGKPGCNVIWIIDEFQRVERTPKGVRDEVNAGLHSTFNAVPNGLCFCFSFSGRPEKQLPPWFSPELRDRIGTTKVMVLPPMLPDEALQFVRDVIQHFRPIEEIDVPTYFPFTEEACKAAIEEIGKRRELKPRSLMQTFRALLEQANPKIASRAISEISPQFVKDVLAEYVTLGAEDEEAE